MKRIITAFLLLSSLIFTTPVSADTIGYGWKTRVPLNLIVVSNLTDTSFNTPLEMAAIEWTKSTVVDLTIGSKPKRGAFVTIRDGYFDATWSGLAVISSDHGHIIGATVYLNKKWLDGSTAETKQRIVCHELGHSLGLAHQTGPDKSTSCLGGSSSFLPNAVDYSDLEKLYR